ncbi:DUF2169 domain-containing protein [Archangium sp.]|uniref:DUF2169 family type VI secretion system accessory protein n=1 Tax=Archangium sp. TaxID=1872627 RepID=UPI002D39B73E|nr:DUF2169 domain-containing protein [Archangium sp.]HYO51811.1 DUF2169 domain-containing protein [Archangium sp.]
MLELRNQTPYPAERTILLDGKGEEHWVVIVKGTFTLESGRLERAASQEPIALADVHHGEPGGSSQKYESDILLRKPSTDILLNGHAHAPEGRPVRQLEVFLQVGSLSKRIRVHGDRVWERGLLGLQASRPQPFERMPLVYERAIGHEEQNPVGVGPYSGANEAAGKPLPNMEFPDHPISSWKDKSPPAGLGVVSKNWEPRRTWAGTYDQRWQEERLPLWPLDLDARFFQAAPPDQVTSDPLRGGDPVLLENLSPRGRLAFKLPRVTFGFTTLLGNGLTHHKANLDTVILEPDVPRVLLVWRTAIPCHRKKFSLKWTEIREKVLISKAKESP